MKECSLCTVEFTSKRADAKFCSPKCRKEASRISSVTDNVTLNAPNVTDNLTFKFTIVQSPEKDKYMASKDKVRKAIYWYDVPLAAVPVLEKGWPAVPIFNTVRGPEPMNGRQYFLWWKNEFKENGGVPEIHNPFPTLTNVTYAMGGEGSRRWGA